ncbi:MAG: ankyrin repeat domain-containing protein [Planctomycetes bacterium]|nr:ankyrin repeat domain-containing protein [Planctomycetota bacterium]
MEAARETFVKAVKAGDIALAREALRSDASLAGEIDSLWFDFDASAMVCAAGRGDRAMVDLLLEHGADIDARSRWSAGGWSALHAAVRRDDGDLAALLIQRGATVDAHAAAGLDRVDRLEELLRADPAIVNARGPDGMTPLHFAATVRIAAWLLDHGAGIDIRDLDHCGTPAQWLVRERPEVSGFLIDRGAEADVHLRCALGRLEDVRAALRADPALLRARSTGDAPGGYVSLYTGVGVGSTLLEVAARFDRVAIAEQLLDAGADLTARGQHGATPLHWAAWHGNTAVLDLLLARGAPVDLRDEEFGSPPLGWAAHGSAHCGHRGGDHVGAVERLVAKGASVNVPGNKWGTQLAAMGTEAVARALERLAAGAGHPPPS